MDDGFFVAFCAYGIGVDFGSHESFGEEVTVAGVGVVVAELELLVGELAVHIEDIGGAGYLVGYLDREDGFVEVGVGKEATDFAFVP